MENKFITQEMADIHFEEFLKRTYTGYALEELEKTGIINHIRNSFMYAFSKGAEECIEQVKVMIKQEQTVDGDTNG